MDLQKFISLLAACIGVLGAVFLSKGVLASNPRDILNTFHQYSHIGYPSIDQISSKSSEKSNTIVGIFLILTAFLFQAISLLITGSLRQDWMCLKTVVLVVLATIVLSSIGNTVIFNTYKTKIGKLAVKDYCSSRLERKRIDPVNIKCLEDISAELLGLKKSEYESMADFINRVAKYVGWTVPEHIDFSKFDDK